MNELNQKYLLRLSQQYRVTDVSSSERDFLLYQIERKKSNCFLLLCNNYEITPDLLVVLEFITRFDSSFKYGNSYLCIVPTENATLDMCTQFNGDTFVHFLFVNISESRLLYDKDFYYVGGKQIKDLIGIYENCFDAHCLKP